MKLFSAILSVICITGSITAVETSGKWTEFSVILQPSPIGGIGTFATHDIPAGEQVFTVSGCCKRRKMNPKDIPAPFVKYCVFLSEEEYLCPERFDRMEIGWYINHSDNPNVIKLSDTLAVAARDIKAGEEVTMDYN